MMWMVKLIIAVCGTIVPVGSIIVSVRIIGGTDVSEGVVDTGRGTM